MGHAMHIVRCEEKRRSREAEIQEEGGGREDDPGGGQKGGERNVKGEQDGGVGGARGEKGRIHLRGALLRTYILSILIRSIMEVCLTVTNMNPAKKQIITLDEHQKSNKLNDFYLRFDRQNFSQEYDRVSQSLHDTDDTCCLEVDPDSIRHLFSRVRTGKAAGPDGLPAFFAQKLCRGTNNSMVSNIQSLNIHTVPAL